MKRWARPWRHRVTCARPTLAAIDRPWVVAILFYLMLLVAMVYGPIAAALAEMFSDPHPLHLHEPALPPWQWLVYGLLPPWRLPSWRRRGHLQRPVVPGADRRGHGGDRIAYLRETVWRERMYADD